jgi:DNA-binding GntR family transcriptional regulator
MPDTLDDSAAAPRQVVLPKPTTTTDALVEELRVAILTGAFAPGEHLHQTQLAERYGVSRIPLRDALARLEGEGIISMDANRQAHVITLTADDVHEIYGIRLMLEPVAARAAVERITVREVAELLHRMDVMYADAEDPSAGLRARRSFYDEFYRLSDQPRLRSIIMRLRDEITVYHLTHPAAHDSHAELRRAIEKRDAGAAFNFMHSHLLKTRDDLAAAMHAIASGAGQRAESHNAE